jgi:hypothetical protein
MLSNRVSVLTLILFPTQPPANIPKLVGAAGCTLTAGAAQCSLVGAEGVLRLCHHGLHYTLVAWALPSRFALRAHSSGFALTTIK